MAIFGQPKISSAPAPDFVGYVYGGNVTFTDAEVSLAWLGMNTATEKLRPVLRTVLSPTLFGRLAALLTGNTNRYAERFGHIRIARVTPELETEAVAVETRFANVTYLQHTQFEFTLDLWYQLRPKGGKVQNHNSTRLIFVPARFAPFAASMQSAMDAYTGKFGSPEGRS